ncbi:MAG TPA: PA2169 family four-helix-bundle protein [Acidobacteriaceae bacterium]
MTDLVETLREGQEGFKELGHHLQDDRAKRLFLEETQVRAEYAAELENELHRMGVHDIRVGISRRSKARLYLAEIKAKLAGGDHDLLVTAEKGEDAAKKAYADALKEDLPLPLRELLDRQQAHILRVYDEVKALRDRR